MRRVKPKIVWARNLLMHYQEGIHDSASKMKEHHQKGDLVEYNSDGEEELTHGRSRWAQNKDSGLSRDSARVA